MSKPELAATFALDRVETRVRPTDAASGRKSWPYWLAIRIGSGLIRRDILRAVRRRAEAVDGGAHHAGGE